MNSNKRMEIIDALVTEFLKTRGRKQEEAFLKAVEPVVRNKARKTCAGSAKWDEDDLYSILMEDMWRLLRVYVPSDKCFHYLMLRQLHNKTINYIGSITERKYKVCFICGASQSHTGIIKCEICGGQLNHPRAWGQVNHDDFIIPYIDKSLADLENREIITTLLGEVKDSDPKTYSILTMYLEGYTKSEISRALGNIPQNALNHRIKKCAKILGNIGEV